MTYRISVNCPSGDPEDLQLAERIIDAASQAGAGATYERYSRVAMVLSGYETWRTEPGAHPYTGTVGAMSTVKSVRIEMECPDDKVAQVVKAIRNVHPYEKPVIEITRLEALPE